MNSKTRRSRLQVRILLNLERAPAKSVSDLASAIGAQRPSVSRSVRTLRKDNLVELRQEGWALTLIGEEEARRCKQELSRVANSLHRAYEVVNPIPAPFHVEVHRDTLESSPGLNPYATGGGGVTFERKVAVQYLAHLLVGHGASEFGEGRRAVNVAFQQAPDQPVDDLVVKTARIDESEPSWEIALEVRRAPKIVSSDQSTRGLILKYVRALTHTPIGTVERHWGLVVAGPQAHARQLAELASLAASQMDADGFFQLARTPSKFKSSVRQRLEHIEALVKLALKEIDEHEPGSLQVRERTWRLLSRLVVLMPRLESPDETDWSIVTNSLISVARNHDLTGASRLQDRLVSLAGEYSPRSARVDMKLLKRDAHDVIDTGVRHHKQGWAALDHLHGLAIGQVRDAIVRIDGSGRLMLDRSTATEELITKITDSSAVLVSGESGVGKSALTLLSLSKRSEANPQEMQVLCINLRQVPKLSLDFEGRLGCPLSMLLEELSAPLRSLIIDGADAVSEGMESAFRYLVKAAADSNVKVIAISAADNKQIAQGILADHFGPDLADYIVPPLTDDELYTVAEAFSELENLYANTRSRELMRRLVVVDLLVRGSFTAVPLSDAEALQQVWSGLVRRNESSERGTPDARESAMLTLAVLALDGGERLGAITDLDKAAIAGLRRDGLLQASAEEPFLIGPDFAHDEVRRYAVARLLAAERDPASRIRSAGTPRWSLPAARLACQLQLELPDSAATPIRGRFTGLQVAFESLVEAGSGARWGDVPSEALLSLSNPEEVLKDAWPAIHADGSVGLQRLSRLVKQRFRKDNGFVDPGTLEPVIQQLIMTGLSWPLDKAVEDLLKEWLNGHIVLGTPRGNGLRVLLRQRLMAVCTTADARLAAKRESEDAARAARGVKEIDQERQLAERDYLLLEHLDLGGRRRRDRPEVPIEYGNDVLLELFALLGQDLGTDGAGILLRIARDAPDWLSPALEMPLTDMGLATYRDSLLARLTEAYYLDDEAVMSDFSDYGIRSHLARSSGLFAPLAAWHRGPFMSLFRSDFRAGVRVLNRMLDHAATVRARTLTRAYALGQDAMGPDIDQYRIQLDVTGTSRQYVGDGHVWNWYRGTGVGPYPCISALQALELECDLLIRSGIPIKLLVPLLLEDCNNLAMVGLVVGLLVRHLESPGELLDPFVIEPLIWELEFNRVVNEYNAMASSAGDIARPERRHWSLREAAIHMALGADDKRETDLRALAEILVTKARDGIVGGHNPVANADRGSSVEVVEQQIAMVQAWASSLDRKMIRLLEAPDGYRIEVTPSEEVVQVLQKSNVDTERFAEDLRLTNRYSTWRREARADAIAPQELAADLALVRVMLETPSELHANRPLDTPALVIAEALCIYFERGVDLPVEDLVFAVRTMLRISEGVESSSPLEFEETYFEDGADRSAARVLPLLLLPTAATLREATDGRDGATTYNQVSAAGLRFARVPSYEVRLQLARGLDHLWASPCVQGDSCHHQIGLQIVKEMMRDCTVGEWAIGAGGRSEYLLHEPLAESLQKTEGGRLLPHRLDAPIRAPCPRSWGRQLHLSLLAHPTNGPSRRSTKIAPKLQGRQHGSSG